MDDQGYDFRAVAKSAGSKSQEMTRPETNPQNAAPTFSNAMSATVTRKATRAPREKRSLNAAAKAACNTRNIARPAKTVTSDLGAISSSRVKVGAKSPNKIARHPTNIPEVYWRLRSPLATTIAFAGPVRQVLTPPTTAAAADPMPQAIVTASIGGL